MNLMDIIALAKSGYSVADVKELMALDTKTTQPTESENIQVEESPNKEVENTTVDDQKTEVHNYKEMYEELAGKYTELETQLKQVQELNTHSTVGKESQEDIATSFGDFAREFM